MKPKPTRWTHARTEGPDRAYLTRQDTCKRRAGDIMAHFDHPHTTGGPAINGCPTRLRPRFRNSPTTSPEHSSKPEDSNSNYTPNYEEPFHPRYSVMMPPILPFHQGHPGAIGISGRGGVEAGPKPSLAGVSGCGPPGKDRSLLMQCSHRVEHVQLAVQDAP